MTKRIFKFLLQNTLIALVSTAFMFFLLIALIAGFVSSFAEKQPSFPKEAALTFDLGMNLVDTPPTPTLESLLMDAIGEGTPPVYHVRDMIDTLERARDDRRVKALFLHGSLQSLNYASSFPALSELREAIIEFKASGKPVIAYSVYPSTRDLYVMSVADEFYLNQSGAIMLPGLYSEPMFFKDALDKYGIGVQAIRVGAFKSAIEPYTRTNLSDEARSASTLLLNELWQEILSDIAEAREMDLQTANQLLDSQAILYAQDAVEAGFVSRIASHVEVRNRMSELVGKETLGDTFQQIGLAEYVLEKDQFGRKPSGEGIAVVYAEGAIVGGEGEDYEAGAERIVRNLRNARQDNSTRAIVFRVNSPGGGATASKIIQDELLAIKEQGIPLVVSMGGYAASGGYLISQSADYIIAHPHTVTGSIGIFGLLMHIGEGAGMLGITFDEIKTTQNSDLLSISKPKSEAQLDMIQTYLQEFYDQWTTSVASHRGQEVDAIRAVAGGRVWSGDQAVELGLVDALGGLQDAINHAAEMAELGEKFAVYDYPRKLSPDEAFSHALGLQSALASAANRSRSPSVSEIHNWLHEVEQHLSLLSDPGGAYAYLPLRYR